MSDDDKDIVFVGSSQADIRSFSKEARAAIGHQLNKLEQNEFPDNFKPMGTVGAGVYEIRVHVGDAYRVFYVAKFETAIYVLHAFKKKTAKTPQSDIDLAKTRYGLVLAAQLELKKKKMKREQ